MRSRTRTMKKIYDQILPFAIEHKPWIKQFWDSADNTKSGLMENDVWIGQTWDGPALSLKKEGKPVILPGAEGRRHRLARRPLAHQGVEEPRPGLCLPRISPDAGSLRRCCRRFGLQPDHHRRRRAALRRRQEELPGSLPGRCAEEPLAPPRRALLVRGNPHASTPTSSRRPDQPFTCTDIEPAPHRGAGSFQAMAGPA